MARPKIDQIANLQTELTSTSDSANNRVLKTGDTMTGQLNVSSGGLIVQSNDSDRAAFIRSPTRTLRITPYYNSEGTNRGTWLEAINTANAAYNKLTLSGSDLIFDARGNVGIGTNSPTANLHLIGSANVTGNAIFSGGNLFVDSVGNRVGIANSNPNTGYYGSSLKLQVGTAPNNNYTIAAVEAGTQPSLYLRHPIGYTEFYNSYGNIGLSAYLNGEGKSLNTDIFYFRGYNDTANAYLSFFSDKLYIAGNGNVGIGTTSPTANLHVTGTIKDTPILSVTSSGTYADNAAGRVIFANTTSAITITAAAAATAGFSYTVIRGNTGNVTIANSGVTRLNSASITTMNVNQFGAVTVVYTATNQVIVFGDFVA